MWSGDCDWEGSAGQARSLSLCCIVGGHLKDLKYPSDDQCY